MLDKITFIKQILRAYLLGIGGNTAGLIYLQQGKDKYFKIITDLLYDCGTRHKKDIEELEKAKKLRNPCRAPKSIKVTLQTSAVNELLFES
jgi:hypothetical protein